MVFILYLYCIYFGGRANQERRVIQGINNFSIDFFLESLDFCLLLHLEK